MCAGPFFQVPGYEHTQSHPGSRQSRLRFPSCPSAGPAIPGGGGGDRDRRQQVPAACRSVTCELLGATSGSPRKLCVSEQPAGRGKDTLSSQQLGPTSCLASVTPGRGRDACHRGEPRGVVFCSYGAGRTRHSHGRHRGPSLTHQARKRSLSELWVVHRNLLGWTPAMAGRGRVKGTGSRLDAPRVPCSSPLWPRPGEQTTRS